jgi:calcium permeable stress-gated cation channel
MFDNFSPHSDLRLICALLSGTEMLDDLQAIECAARAAHASIRQFRLPPLPFTNHADEISRIPFAPPSIVWLSSVNADVARAEARDLEQFHGLKAVIELCSSYDVILLRCHHLNGTS